MKNPILKMHINNKFNKFDLYFHRLNLTVRTGNVKKEVDPFLLEIYLACGSAA